MKAELQCKKAAVIAAGSCPISRAIAEAVSARLAADGAAIVSAPEDADIAVIAADIGPADGYDPAAGEAFMFECYTAAKKAASAMKQRGAGSIVFVVPANAAGPVEGQLARNITSAGIVAFAKAAALEFADIPVRVNAVLFSFIENVRPGDETALLHLPSHKPASLEQITSAVAFLADDASAAVTAAALPADNGWSSGYARKF